MMKQHRSTATTAIIIIKIKEKEYELSSNVYNISREWQGDFLQSYPMVSTSQRILFAVIKDDDDGDQMTNRKRERKDY